MNKFNVNPLMIPDKIQGVIFVDCEATGLTNPSYPMSIALYSSDGFHSQCLIKPEKSWKNFNIHPEAYKIHKISLEDLNDGYSIQDVSEWLQKIALLMPDINLGKVFFSDNPQYEAHWISQLFLNNSKYPGFRIADSRNLISGIKNTNKINDADFDRILEKTRDIAPHTHNAIDDAKFWALFYNELIKVRP